MQRHGFRRAFQNIEKLKATLLERYGVEYITQLPGMGRDNWKKAHNTKKRKGTYAASKVERDFCDLLRNQAIEFDVQVEVFGRPIDVKIGDVYVQIDGRYWHGLDRPIEVIRSSGSLRDKSIYERWLSDRHQDEQFANSGLTLIRLTDLEVKEWLKEKKNIRLLI